MLISTRSMIWTAIAVAATISDWQICSAALVPVSNPSFELPVAPAIPPVGQSQAYVVPQPSIADQGGAGWVFNGGGGVAARGAMFAGGIGAMPSPPDGNQAAWLSNLASISQVLSFPTTGQYAVEYWHADDPLYDVLIDGNSLSPPFSATAAFTQFALPFSTTAGSHMLTFQNTDNSLGPAPGFTFIDDVAVVPEPACGVLLGLGLVLIRRKIRP